MWKSGNQEYRFRIPQVAGGIEVFLIS